MKLRTAKTIILWSRTEDKLSVMHVMAGEIELKKMFQELYEEDVLSGAVVISYKGHIDVQEARRYIEEIKPKITDETPSFISTQDGTLIKG